MSPLNFADLFVIAAFFLFIFTIAVNYSRKTGKDTEQFFLSSQVLSFSPMKTEKVTEIAVSQTIRQALNEEAHNV